MNRRVCTLIVIGLLAGVSLMQWTSASATTSEGYPTIAQRLLAFTGQEIQTRLARIGLSRNAPRAVAAVQCDQPNQIDLNPEVAVGPIIGGVNGNVLELGTNVALSIAIQNNGPDQANVGQAVLKLNPGWFPAGVTVQNFTPGPTFAGCTFAQATSGGCANTQPIPNKSYGSIYLEVVIGNGAKGTRLGGSPNTELVTAQAQNCAVDPVANQGEDAEAGDGVSAVTDFFVCDRRTDLNPEVAVGTITGGINGNVLELGAVVPLTVALQNVGPDQAGVGEARFSLNPGWFPTGVTVQNFTPGPAFAGCTFAQATSGGCANVQAIPANSSGSVSFEVVIGNNAKGARLGGAPNTELVTVQAQGCATDNVSNQGEDAEPGDGVSPVTDFFVCDRRTDLNPTVTVGAITGGVSGNVLDVGAVVPLTIIINNVGPDQASIGEARFSLNSGWFPAGVTVQNFTASPAFGGCTFAQATTGGCANAQAIPANSSGSISFEVVVGANAAGARLGGSPNTELVSVQTWGCATDTVANQGEDAEAGDGVGAAADFIVRVCPSKFNVTGGGTFCANDTGVAVGLDGSQTGMNYQLIRDGITNVGAAIPGTGQALSFGLQTTGGTYTVIATEPTFGCSTTMTGNAVVTVNPVTTTTALANQTVCQGSNVSFTTTASGTAPFSFVWKKGATTINTGITTVGATSTLNLSNVQPADADNYSVEVTGTCGTVTQSALLTVNPLPVASAGGAQTICQNGTTTGLGGNTPPATTAGQWTSNSGGTFTPNATTPNATWTPALNFTGVATLTWTVRSTAQPACGTTQTATVQVTVNEPPTVTTQPAPQIVGQSATATFTAAATGTPTPTVQWQVDTGNGFTNIPGATSTTLTVPNVTLAMNGNRYRAVFTNSCGSATSQAALLTVNALNLKLGDPLLCLTADGLVGVTVTITNNHAAAVNTNFTATLPSTLNGLPGTGLASLNPGGITVTNSAVIWMGTIPANTTVTLTYKARITAGTPANQPICVESDVVFNGGPKAVVQECQVLNCPANGSVKVSDQKAGSVLVFPYYVSKRAEKKDTRLTISNLSDKPISAHIFFIDGTTCQQADQFLCLTPYASFSFKASEQDPEATGWLLVVAVDAQGRPTRANGLIGNAFVNDGEYVDNYGAEAFQAHSTLLATVTGDTATLFFDNQSYDVVPNQFAVEIQSPLDAPNQRVVTVGLQGDLTRSALSGAAQIGTATVLNGNERPLGSFVSWLSGNCQAQATITTSSPRVPGGMNGLIPKGQIGTMQFRIGAGVGLLMTPRTASWPGIRTLHKTGSTATTLTIPLLPPVC